MEADRQRAVKLRCKEYWVLSYFLKINVAARYERMTDSITASE